MTKTNALRAEVQRLVRQTPFHPFALFLDNGQQIVIDHPENIAFKPGNADGTSGSEDFYVLTDRLHYFGTFSAVSSIARLDHGLPNGST